MDDNHDISASAWIGSVEMSRFIATLQDLRGFELYVVTMGRNRGGIRGTGPL